MFQDVYDWAGEVRTVMITKGASTFHNPNRIAAAAQYTFGKLHDGPLLNPAVGDEAFLAGVTDLLDDVNYIHPFREGNGRAQRAFLDQVAKVSGRTLTWRNVSATESNFAAEESVARGKAAPLREFLSKVVQPPIVGAPGFDLDAYRVQPPDTVAGNAGVRTSRCRRCGRPLSSEESSLRGYGPSCWNRRHE